MKSLHGLKDAVSDTIRRFPLPVICSTLFTLLAVWGIWAEPGISLLNYLCILFFGCFWFIALKLLYENNPALPRHYYVFGSILFIVVAIYLYLQADVAAFSRAFLCGGAVLLIFLAPYLPTPGTNDFHWTFGYRVALRIAFTFLAAIILYLGLLALLESVQFLFHIRSLESGKIYLTFWVIVAAFFSPLFAMAGIPRVFSEYEEPYPKFLRILVCNFVIPLWFAYGVVVYAYIAKILFTMHMPDGGVALLVSIFGAKGVVLYLACYPLYERRLTIAYTFGKYWSKLLILPLILFAAAIAERIHEHGVTEDRYVVVLCLIWLMLAIGERFRSETQAPRRILIWAVVLLFATAFGPWSVDSLSADSQLGRLRQVLEKNHMFTQGRLVAPVDAVSFADREAISSTVSYLYNKQKLELIKPWFDAKYQGDITDKNTTEDRANYEWPPERIVQDMGIAFAWPGQDERQNRNDNFTYNQSFNDQVVDVSGYDYAIRLNNYASMCSLGGHAITIERGKGRPPMIFSASFDPANGMFALVNKDSGQKLTFAIAALFKKDEWPDQAKKKMMLEGENSEMKVRIMVELAFGKFTDDKAELSSFGTFLLIKLKP